MMVWLAFGGVALCFVGIEWLYARRWQSALCASIHLPQEDVHEGECAAVKEVIINDKFLPLPVLEVFFALDKGLRYTDGANTAVSDKSYRRDVFCMGAKQKISRSFSIDCAKRGYYTLTQFDMMSSDLFFYQKFLATRTAHEAFHVYPRKVASERIALPYQRIMGDFIVRQKLYEDPFSFAGIRDYTPSDPMNRINWNASAKTQDLAVNMRDSSMNQRVVLLLDTAEHTGSYSDALNEESIRIAAALIERLLPQGVEITLCSNAKDAITHDCLSLTDIKGLSVALIKQHLARLTLGGEAPLDTLFAAFSRDTYVVVLSKNTEIAHAVHAAFDDFLWILPYRESLPTLSISYANVLPWAYNTHLIP